jgi:hypothetical protein
MLTCWLEIDQVRRALQNAYAFPTITRQHRDHPETPNKTNIPGKKFRSVT